MTTNRPRPGSDRRPSLFADPDHSEGASVPGGDRVLVVIRGNSGSGKSTIAQRLRDAHGQRTLAIVDQDTARRKILRERDQPGAANIDLLALMASFALSRGFHVVLEGILDAGRYSDMLDQLHEQHPGPQHWYYLDIPFTETLRRHAGGPQAADFTEAEMARWYTARDLLPDGRETVIGPGSSLEQSLTQILADTSLTTGPTRQHPQRTMEVPVATISTAQHGTADYWSTVYDKGEHFIQLTDQERDLLAALAPEPGGRALDLGCGTGTVTRYLAELGYQATGLDYSETAIRRARADTAPGTEATYVCADLAEVPDIAEEGSVDLLVCRLAASFLDGTLLLDRVRHWLAPRGRFVVVVPDPQYLNPARRTIYLDETQLAELSRGWRSVERHRVGQLLVLVLGDWAPSHRAAEKRTPTPNSLFGVGIVVQDPQTGKVLLGHSARFPGLLEAVGGKLETGTVVEDLRHTAARELEEETGLKADPADVQLRSVLIDQRGVPRVTVAAYISKFSGQPRATEPDLIRAWEWFPVGEPLPGEVFKPTLDVLATCFPEHFHADRPARRYDLHHSYTTLPAARTPAAPGELSPEHYAASRSATWSSSAVLFTDPHGRVLLLEPTYRPSWVLPGGGNEMGEYPNDAASREVREETGLERDFTSLLVMDTVPPNTAEADPRWRFPGATHTVWDGGELTEQEIVDLRMSRESRAVHLLEPADLPERMTPGEARRTMAALRARIDGTKAVLRDGYPLAPSILDRYAALHTPRPPRRPRAWHPGEEVPDGTAQLQCAGWFLGLDGRVLVLLDPDTGLASLPGAEVRPAEDPAEALGRGAAEAAQVLIGAPIELGYLLDEQDPNGPTAQVCMAAAVRRVLPAAAPSVGRKVVRLWANPLQAAQLLGWGPQGTAQARAAMRVAAVGFRLPTPASGSVTEVPTEGGAA